MANDQHSLSSFFKSAYFWIFIVSFITCILSVYFGHKDCSDWDAGDETCWGNEYLHNVYKIGFLVGVISGFPVAIKLLPYLWRKALLWSKNSQLFREFGWLLLILVIALYPYHMVTNPDCYGDDGDFTGCEEGTFDSDISVAGLLGFVFSLIILGVTGSGDDDEIPQDQKWWILFPLILIGWVCYWIVSSIIGSEFGEVIGEMFAKSPVLMSCMTIGLIVLVVISDWSGADSDVTVSKDSYSDEKMNKDRYIPQFTGSAISKKDNIRINNRGPITDKTLPGWNKNCEYCGNEFEVTLREKELGFFGLLGAIRKQVKTVFKADNTKNWDYSKNPDQHFCSSCLRKGDPIDWYCPRCKITKNKCDCFDIVKCTECGTEVTKMNLYGTCCFECYMDHKNAESPYETY